MPIDKVFELGRRAVRKALVALRGKIRNWSSYYIEVERKSHIGHFVCGWMSRTEHEYIGIQSNDLNTGLPIFILCQI